MTTSGWMRHLRLIWPTLSWSPTCSGTRRGMCGFRCLPTRPGGTCCRIQRYTGMIRGDGFLGFHMGCGCFFLGAGRRARSWRVRLSGLHPCSEADRAAFGFQVVMPVGVQRQVPWGYRLSPGPSSCVSLRWLLGEFRARVVHTWKFGAFFRRGFVSGSHMSCV